MTREEAPEATPTVTFFPESPPSSRTEPGTLLPSRPPRLHCWPSDLGWGSAYGITSVSGDRNQADKQRSMARTVGCFDDEASLSNRLDMEPLGPHDVLPGWLLGFDSGAADAPGAPMYMAALPFPGRAGGTRFTTTDEDLGIICESSLNSARNDVLRATTLGQR
jgi:hypothetical protein